MVDITASSMTPSVFKGIDDIVKTGWLFAYRKDCVIDSRLLSFEKLLCRCSGSFGYVKSAWSQEIGERTTCIDFGDPLRE